MKPVEACWDGTTIVIGSGKNQGRYRRVLGFEQMGLRGCYWKVTLEPVDGTVQVFTFHLSGLRANKLMESELRKIQSQHIVGDRHCELCSAPDQN